MDLFGSEGLDKSTVVLTTSPKHKSNTAVNPYSQILKQFPTFKIVPGKTCNGSLNNVWWRKILSFKQNYRHLCSFIINYFCLILFIDALGKFHPVGKCREIIAWHQSQTFLQYHQLRMQRSFSSGIEAGSSLIVSMPEKKNQIKIKGVS